MTGRTLAAISFTLAVTAKGNAGQLSAAIRKAKVAVGVLRKCLPMNDLLTKVGVVAYPILSTMIGLSILTVGIVREKYEAFYTEARVRIICFAIFTIGSAVWAVRWWENSTYKALLLAVDFTLLGCYWIQNSKNKYHLERSYKWIRDLRKIH